MKSLTAIKSEWRTWTTLIFWGVVALTVFGWFAGFLELFTGITGSIQPVLDMASEFGQTTDQMAYVNEFLRGFNQTLGIFEFLTFASWVVYLVGLYKFRDAQTTTSAAAGVKAINNACWTGLVAMAFSMFAVWSPLFVGLVFRFAGWIIGLVSYFMFRSAFRSMESEAGWNELARRGATLLRKSANYGVWLQFMPIIIFFVVLIVGLTTFSSVVKAANFNYGGNGSSMGVHEYVGLYIFIGTILGLSLLALSILQLVYRIWGWKRVMSGAPVAAESGRTIQCTTVAAGQFCSHCGRPVDSEARFCQGCGTEIIPAASVQAGIIEEDDEEPTVESEDEYDEEEPEDNIKRNWLIGGGIALVVVLLLVFMIKSCSSTQEKIANAEEATAELISGNEAENPVADVISEEIAGTPAEEEAENDWNATTTDEWTGTINGKYKIAMTINRLDGAVWGSYMYLSQKREIALDGEWGDNNQLTLTESVDGNVTGQFIGEYDEFTFEGLWISSDGEKEMPFSVTLQSRQLP